MTNTVTGKVNRVPFYMLCCANIISVTGTMLSSIAIPWFVLQTTHSATQTGVTAFFSVLPTIIAAFLGGVLVDRLGYKRTSILADFSSAIAIGLIPMLFGLGGLNFWLLQLLVFAGHFFDAPGATARFALIPELAALANIPVERALAFNEAAMRATRLIGGPLAGLLIATVGADKVLWLDAASFVISGVLVAIAIPISSATSESKSTSYLADLKEGLSFVRQDRLIQSIIFIVMITNLLDGALFSVIYPVYAEQVFGSTVPLGILIAAVGGAALVGSLLMSLYGDRLPRRATFAIGFIMAGLRYFALGLFAPLWVLILFSIVAGLGASPINPILSTVQLERIPSNMRARVIGVISAGSIGAIPLGVLITGFVLERFGLGQTLLLYGTVYVLTAASTFLNSTMQQLEKVKAIEGNIEANN